MNSATGISGAWYAFGDGWGSNGRPPGNCEMVGKHDAGQCSVITSPKPSVDAGAEAGVSGFPWTAPQEFCLEGYAAQVIGSPDDYSNIFGIGFGVNLNNPSGTPMPFNATKAKVVGFQFVITGTANVGGIRFSVPMTTDVPADEPYNTEVMTDSTTAHPTVVLFTDLGTKAYTPPAGNPTFDATILQAVEWQVISNTTATNPPHGAADVCISHLAALVAR
jgi:hypothetical protein